MVVQTGTVLNYSIILHCPIFQNNSTAICIAVSSIAHWTDAVVATDDYFQFTLLRRPLSLNSLNVLCVNAVQNKVAFCRRKVYHIASILESHETYGDVQTIAHAKVPIVKVFHRATLRYADLSIYNTLVRP